MDYIEFKVEVLSENISTEIIIAYLNEFGFESFAEKENIVFAYIQQDLFSEDPIKAHYFFKENQENLRFSFVSVKDKNWNEEWESNYDPVLIDNKCMVRAPFHPKEEKAEFDIVIEPKMSFGTAHHPTTALMIRQLLPMKLRNKTVIDMGCGTGVLAILAALKDAAKITAIDNSDWAYHNTLENINKNDVKIEAQLGDAGILKNCEAVDVFLANINRNILLNDIPIYAPYVKERGMMILSGFFEKDLDAIQQKCIQYNFKFIDYLKEDEWVAAKFLKSINTDNNE